MKVSTRATPRLAAGVFAATLALAGVQRADAQSVFFSGFTAGCFTVGCTPVTGVTTYPSTNGAMYTSGTFSGTTTNGSLTIDATSLSNFGTFHFGNLGAQIPGGYDYTGLSFTLLITFIDPIANQNTFQALLSGTVVKPIGQQNVDIDFDNTVQYFGPGGIYSVQVDDVFNVVPETNTGVGGTLTATSQAVPEPITMILLGTGLAGLGAARRRRNRVTKADLI